MEFFKLTGWIHIILFPVHLIALGLMVAACIAYVRKNRTPHSHLLLMGSLLLLVPLLTNTVSGYMLFPNGLISRGVLHWQRLIAHIVRCIGIMVFALGFRGVINRTTET